MAVVIACCRLRGDWCGIATCAFIFICWIYAFYCSVFTIISQHFVPLPDTKNVLLTGYFTVSFLTIFTMAKCVLSDPGKLLDVSNAGLLGWEYCKTCGKHRPPRSHHCSRCAQCVRKMDHHCPWINNCVGEDNNMRFTQFLLYTALMAWFSLALCLSFFMDWLPTCAPCLEEEVALDIKIEVVCLTFISAAYAFFTSFMFFDRLIMISADVTTLELMRDRSMIKNSFRNPRKPSWFTLFSRTFGSSNIISWFIPCRTVQIRPSYEYDSYSWQDHI